MPTGTPRLLRQRKTEVIRVFNFAANFDDDHQFFERQETPGAIPSSPALPFRCLLLLQRQLRPSEAGVPRSRAIARTSIPSCGHTATSASSRPRHSGYSSTRPSKKRCVARPETIASGSRRCGRGGGTTITFTSACDARLTVPNASRKRRRAEAMAAARTSIIGSPTPCCIPSRHRDRSCLSRASRCRACPRRAVQC
jgi:hypothetical protein